MKYSIFSIDNASDPAVLNSFLGSFKSSNPKGNLVPAIGSYKGEVEYSFICNSEDYDKIVVPQKWVTNQESVLRVSSCNKQYARLEYKDGSIEGIGSLKSVDHEEAMKHTSWTYRPDLKCYWVSVKGNPDTIPPQEGW